ncbi:MAG: adenylyltransferase/cytidyltransferase family protein, partial [bacterium]|nr:adenylyltransferase/cytidyltransferase family protein [bacterium]
MRQVKTLNEIKKISEKLKKEGKIIVFTNGCFDIIHPGHIKLLKKAKSIGDILIVGLNSDM